MSSILFTSLFLLTANFPYVLPDHMRLIQVSRLSLLFSPNGSRKSRSFRIKWIMSCGVWSLKHKDVWPSSCPCLPLFWQCRGLADKPLGWYSDATWTRTSPSEGEMPTGASSLGSLNDVAASTVEPYSLHGYGPQEIYVSFA